jgi:phenylacetate-CoA ligase
MRLSSPALPATPEPMAEPAPWPRLAGLLPQWREIPLYRARLAAGIFSPEDFARLPFVTKPELRENFPHNFLAPEQSLAAWLDEGRAELEYTSGTSQEQTPVMFRRGWWDEQEGRALRLNEFVAGALAENPAPRRATLTPPVCNGRACPTVWASREQRTIGASLFLNLARIPFTLAEADLARMAQEIAEWSPLFLDVDPVHAVWFALHCERQGLKFPSLQFILSSYEFTSVVHRRILQRAFGVPVLNLYGSTEAGHLLMEDTHGKMSPSAETAYLELVNVDAGGVGELVVTSLSNELMPLIRYRTGDLVARREEACGTTYVIHGRARDALRAGDGRRVTTLEVDRCFENVAGLAHYELRQAADGNCVLRFVPDVRGPEAMDLANVIRHLEALLQTPVKITAESLPMVVPTHSGKFRLTVPNAG